MLFKRSVVDWIRNGTLEFDSRSDQTKTIDAFLLDVQSYVGDSVKPPPCVVNRWAEGQKRWQHDRKTKRSFRCPWPKQLGTVYKDVITLIAIAAYYFQLI